MSERYEYAAGVPCWVDVLVPDPGVAPDFYGDLFGWDFTEPGPNGYRVARIRGRDVAGLGQAQAMPSWNTYVRVTNVEASVAKTIEAGGKVLLEPTDALPAGRLAVIIDPTGAALALWEAGEREGAEVVNEAGAWAMSSLHTPDPAAASAFYAEVFGWRAEPFGALTVFRLEGYSGGRPNQATPRDTVAVMAPPADEIPPHWSVNLQVSDADLTIEVAAKLGGTVILGPLDTPGFRSAVLADPQGAVFSVSQPASVQ